MTPPPTHRPAQASDIATILGAILRALLAALFGANVRRRDALRAGVAPAALCAAESAAAMLEGEVAEEWIAVPAPWRNARWGVPPFPGARELACEGASAASRGLASAARTRAPPIPFSRPHHP